MIQLKESSPHLYDLLERNFDAKELSKITLAYDLAAKNQANLELDGVKTIAKPNPRLARIGVIMLKEQGVKDPEKLISAFELATASISDSKNSTNNSDNSLEAELAIWLDRIRHSHLIPEIDRASKLKDLLLEHPEHVAKAKSSNSPLLDKLLHWGQRNQNNQ